MGLEILDSVGSKSQLGTLDRVCGPVRSTAKFYEACLNQHGDGGITGVGGFQLGDGMPHGSSRSSGWWV